MKALKSLVISGEEVLPLVEGGKGIAVSNGESSGAWAASGGVGTLDHLVDGITIGGATGVLAASIFHYGEYTVGQAKARMAERGIPVRL